MTDSEKLIKLAEWFDLKNPGEGDEVQQDLRRIADLVNQYEREAIIYGMPEVVKQLSAKEQEITDLKTCVDNFSDMYQEKCTELASVRADYDDQSLKVKRQADHIEVLRAERDELKNDKYSKNFTLEEAKDKIAANSHYKTWANIVDEFHGTDDYSEYLEKAAKLAISSAEQALNDEVKTNENLSLVNQDLIIKEIELRKRCEDLEGLLKEWLSQYGWPGKSLTIDTKKLLNQIKS